MPEGGGPVHYYRGVDWADQAHAVWVGDERGTKITTRTVPHTAEGMSEWGRELDETPENRPPPWAARHRAAHGGAPSPAAGTFPARADGVRDTTAVKPMALEMGRAGDPERGGVATHSRRS